MDFSDDQRLPMYDHTEYQKQDNFWHSTAFSLGTNCKSVGTLGCICPMCQLMENRKRFHKEPSVTIAERFHIPISTVGTFCMSWFCGPCLIWQDAHELKEREEGVTIPTFQGDLSI
eukprot:MONOS_2584.1-p1 / transcript=MONOS_2584.1 / gene=MONOS_2584 / organism=Monocercomonoides_exilis_PA203 / gene_product=unspecified product / transcript_product=unspecified product / location=Mono_scaffold00054:67046-67670(+) / protein_length=116 / sequence_SO=supercontig / SO=protein_coding / is_pseudo=false